MADDAADAPSHPPGLWQPPREWNEAPSGAAVVASAACGLPYLVMLLLGLAFVLPVTLSTGVARDVSIGLGVATLMVLVGAVRASRTARLTCKVADRALASLCVAGAIAYVPLVAITIGVAQALAT